MDCSSCRSGQGSAVSTIRYTGRMLRSGEAKNLHFRDSLHRFMWHLAWPRGTWVRLATLNFTPIGSRVGTWPPNGKKIRFLVKSPFDRRDGFYTPNYPALAFYIWGDSLRRLRSYCWETARRSFSPKFSVQRTTGRLPMSQQYQDRID